MADLQPGGWTITVAGENVTKGADTQCTENEIEKFAAAAAGEPRLANSALKSGKPPPKKVPKGRCALPGCMC